MVLISSSLYYNIPPHKLTTWLPQQRSYLKVTYVVSENFHKDFYSHSGVYFLVLTWMVKARVEWQLSVLMSTCKFNSVISGYHIYKTVWTPLTDETLQVWKIPTNMMNMLYTAIMH